jgi:small subunit ribosomal protein S4
MEMLAETTKKSTECSVRRKQKLKFNYGLTESQLFRYVKEARRRRGVTGLIFINFRNAQTLFALH